RPGRGSSTNPSRRSATKRRRHLAAMPRVIPSRSPISVFFRPSAAASTTRERIASAWALFLRRAQASSCSRSSSLKTTDTARGSGIREVYRLLHANYCIRTLGGGRHRLVRHELLRVVDVALVAELHPAQGGLDAHPHLD